MSTTTNQTPPRLTFIDDSDAGGGTMEVESVFNFLRITVKGAKDESDVHVLCASRTEARNIAQFILDVTEEAP